MVFEDSRNKYSFRNTSCITEVNKNLINYGFKLQKKRSKSFIQFLKAQNLINSLKNINSSKLVSVISKGIQWNIYGISINQNRLNVIFISTSALMCRTKSDQINVKRISEANLSRCFPLSSPSRKPFDIGQKSQSLKYDKSLSLTKINNKVNKISEYNVSGSTSKGNTHCDLCSNNGVEQHRGNCCPRNRILNNKGSNCNDHKPKRLKFGLQIGTDNKVQPTREPRLALQPTSLQPTSQQNPMNFFKTLLVVSLFIVSSAANKG